MAAILGEKRPKTGRKIFWVKSWFLRGVFTSKCKFVTTNFQKYFPCQHLILTLNRYKNRVTKMHIFSNLAEFFL
jgi:hypothetical protein